MGREPPPADPRRDGNAIELELSDIRQLFNSLDPSPFTEKDLDPDAEEFIVDWVQELSHMRRSPLRLVIHLNNPLPDRETALTVQEAIRHYFKYRASISRLALRQLLRQGRTSLVIGLAFLIGCLSLAELAAHRAPPGALPRIIREGLTIAGWVAMWRPMQIYLYDWWPLRSRVGLFERLSRMDVDVRTPVR